MADIRWLVASKSEGQRLASFKINLKDRFNKSAQDLKKQFESELNISVINKEFFATIDKFSPYGIGNPKPKFLIRDCFIKYPRIVGEKHYSFFVENSFGDRIKAISFNSVGTSLGKVIETENFTKSIDSELDNESMGWRRKCRTIFRGYSCLVNYSHLSVIRFYNLSHLW